MANGGRIPDDPGLSERGGGSAYSEEHNFMGGGSPLSSRGGFGAETTGVTSSKLSGNVHSSRGFRRALKQTQQRSDRLAGQLPSKQSFGGPGFNKPNYFGQGGNRRGLHIGSGAPATLPASNRP